MLVETLPLTYSIGLALLLSSLIFVWRYVALRKKALNALYNLPSVIVAGPKLVGKTSLIKLITNNDVSVHMFEDSLKFCRLKMDGQILQFIELPSVVDSKPVSIVSRKTNLQRLRIMNLKHLIYVFDMSKSSGTIENQLIDLENIKQAIGDIPQTIIANKVQNYTDEKLSLLKSKFGKVYEIPAFKDSNIDSKNLLQLNREFEDIADLVDGLSHDISTVINGSKLAT